MAIPEYDPYETSGAVERRIDSESKTVRKRGRPAGKRNGYTVEREKRIQEAMDLATELLGDETIARMMPKDVMMFAMRLMLKNGWVMKAAEIADRVAPYYHPRLSSTEVNANIRRDISDYDDEELIALARIDSGEDGAGEETRLPN